MGFTDRAADQHNFFSGNHTPNTTVKDWIADGDHVEVCLSEDFASLVEVQQLDYGRYRGKVRNFHHSPHEITDGIALDTIVEFEERHVRSCYAPEPIRSGDGQG